MTRRTHFLIRSLSLLVAFALVGAACTSSDDDAAPDDPSGALAPAPTRVTLRPCPSPTSS